MILVAVLFGLHVLAIGYWLGKDIVDSFLPMDRKLQRLEHFEYCIRFLRLVKDTSRELANHGAEGLSKSFPDLGSGYSISSGSGRQPFTLYTTGSIRVEFPQHIEPLIAAMEYTLAHYSDFRKWRLRNGSSFNLHAYAFFYMPIYLCDDGITGRLSIENFVGCHLLHEPMHDLRMYRWGHKRFAHLLPTIADVSGRDAWTQLMNFFRAAKDEKGRSLLENIVEH